MRSKPTETGDWDRGRTTNELLLDAGELDAFVVAKRAGDVRRMIAALTRSGVPRNEAEAIVERDHANFWNRAASEIGISVEGLEFVCDALRVTPQYRGEEPVDIKGPIRHCTAEEFCSAFVQFAQDTFGSDYRAALQIWNLDTSEKVGRVVYELIGRNLLEREDGDQQSDFDGRFDL
jgi:uncharacterized repeat protein (TIGR04138 family)